MKKTFPAPVRGAATLLRAAVLVALAGLLQGGCTPAGPASPPGPAPVTVADVPTTPADEARAAELLAAARARLEAGDPAAAERLALEVVDTYPGAPASAPALLLAARGAAARGDTDAALARARRYTELFPADAPEAAAARMLTAGLEEERERLARERASAIRIAAILPRTGDEVLERYAELVLRGVELAVAQVREERGTEVELQVLDDAGEPARAATLVGELEAAGVAGVIGPILSASLTEAALARRDTLPMLVSPTASERPVRRANAYTLNATESAGAVALADYALASGLRTAATLYPLSMEFQQQAGAFQERFRQGGGEILASVPYDSGMVNFAVPIERVRSAGPAAVFVPAPPRDVRQLAPQLAFFGLSADSTRAVQILGGEAWTEPEVLRSVGARMLEGVVAARTRTGESAQAFRRRYEARYRATLQTPFPALGYDAAMLVMERALGRLAPGQTYAGATGHIQLEAAGAMRETELVRIQGGIAVPVGAGAAVRNQERR